MAVVKIEQAIKQIHVLFDLFKWELLANKSAQEVNRKPESANLFGNGSIERFDSGGSDSLASERTEPSERRGCGSCRHHAGESTDTGDRGGPPRDR